MFYQVSLFMLGMLIGCTGGTREAKSGPEMEMDVYTDTGTGCQYLDHRAGTRGLTPRIAADGHSHMGCKGEKP